MAQRTMPILPLLVGMQSYYPGTPYRDLPVCLGPSTISGRSALLCSGIRLQVARRLLRTCSLQGPWCMQTSLEFRAISESVTLTSRLMCGLHRDPSPCFQESCRQGLLNSGRDAAKDIIDKTARSTGKRSLCMGGAKNHLIAMPDCDEARFTTSNALSPSRSESS